MSMDCLSRASQANLDTILKPKRSMQHISMILIKTQTREPESKVRRAYEGWRLSAKRCKLARQDGEEEACRQRPEAETSTQSMKHTGPADMTGKFLDQERIERHFRPQRSP